MIRTVEVPVALSRCTTVRIGEAVISMAGEVRCGKAGEMRNFGTVMQGSEAMSTFKFHCLSVMRCRKQAAWSRLVQMVCGVANSGSPPAVNERTSTQWVNRIYRADRTIDPALPSSDYPPPRRALDLRLDSSLPQTRCTRWHFERFFSFSP